MQPLHQQKETMVYVAIKELNPAVYNPRKWSKKATDDLTASIKRFGLIDPIIVNKARGNTVVGGHFRLHVAKKLGYTEVPCVFVSIEDEQKEKELNLRLNKNSGDWDWSLLKDWETSLLKEAGFDDAELKEMMDQVLEPVKEDDFDPTATLEAKETKVKPGDVWQLGTHRLMCGDSTKLEDVEKLMDGKKAELLFTSPPYSNMRDYEGGDMSVDKLSSFIEVYDPYCAFQAVNLGLQRKDNEIVQYWDEYLNVAKVIGLKLLSWNVWDKTQGGSIASATAMFMLTHEWIFVFGRKAKDLHRTVPNQMEKYEARHGKNFLSGHDGQKVRQKDGSILETTTKCYTHHQLHSCIQQTPELSKIRESHPAVYPVGLPASYIEAMTNQGNIVCDPFAGSGSTLIACEQTKRICYTMELSEKYCDVVLARWEKLTGQTAIKL